MTITPDGPETFTIHAIDSGEVNAILWALDHISKTNVAALPCADLAREMRDEMARADKVQGLLRLVDTFA